MEIFSHIADICTIILFAFAVISILFTFFGKGKHSYSSEVYIEDKNHIEVNPPSPKDSFLPILYPMTEKQYVDGTIFMPNNTIIRNVKIYKLQVDKMNDGSFDDLYKHVKTINKITTTSSLVITVPRTDAEAKYKVCWKGKYGRKYEYLLSSHTPCSTKDNVTLESCRYGLWSVIREYFNIE